MCYIYAHEKQHQASCDDDIIGGGCPIPSNKTTEALDLIGATIYFIDYWLKALKHNFIERCNLYAFNMNKLFQKIPVELPNQPSPK